MRVLEVEQSGDATLVEHELERVVGDEARVGETVLRYVVAQPAPQEHLDRVGGMPFGAGVVQLLHPPEERELGRRRVGRAPRTRRRPRHRAGSRRCAPARRGTPRAPGRARSGRPRRRGRPGRTGGPSPTRRGRRRGRRRAAPEGRAPPTSRAPRPRRRCGSASRCAVRGHRARAAAARDRRPRRRGPTPVASGRCGSTRVTVPPTVCSTQAASRAPCSSAVASMALREYLDVYTARHDDEHRVDHRGDVGHR